MSTQTQAKMRILVGASSFADASAALNLARRVTLDMVQSIGGLLVDEDSTRSVCALPHQRIISTRGTLLFTPSQAQLHTLMNADARAFEHLLKEIAGPAALDWSFERQVGDLVLTTMRAAAGWDLLIFGCRRCHSFAGKVVVFAPTDADGGRLMALSQSVVGRLRTDLVVFDVDHADLPNSVDEAVRHAAFASVDEAIAMLARTNAQAVLIDLSRGPLRTSEHLKALIDAARCPVIVLGASSAAPKVELKMQFPPATESGREPPAS
jgi:hypothetical protein